MVVSGPGGCFFKHEHKLAIAYWSLPALFKAAVSSFAFLKVHSCPNHAPIEGQGEVLQSWHVLLLALSACAPPTPSLPPSPAGGGRDKRAGLGQEDGANLEVLSFAPKQAASGPSTLRSAIQFPHVTLKIERLTVHLTLTLCPL
jgi:hypothetical protein